MEIKRGRKFELLAMAAPGIIPSLLESFCHAFGLET